MSEPLVLQVIRCQCKREEKEDPQRFFRWLRSPSSQDSLTMRAEFTNPDVKDEYLKAMQGAIAEEGFSEGDCTFSFETGRSKDMLTSLYIQRNKVKRVTSLFGEKTRTEEHTSESSSK